MCSCSCIGADLVYLGTESYRKNVGVTWIGLERSPLGRAIALRAANAFGFCMFFFLRLFAN